MSKNAHKSKNIAINGIAAELFKWMRLKLWTELSFELNKEGDLAKICVQPRSESPLRIGFQEEASSQTKQLPCRLEVEANLTEIFGMMQQECQRFGCKSGEFGICGVAKSLLKTATRFRAFFPHEHLLVKATSDADLDLKIKSFVNGIQVSGNSVETSPKPTAALDFLSKTIVPRPSMRKRSSLFYLTTYSWRKDLQKHQIAAARTLKRSFNYVDLEIVSDNILEVLEGFMGDMKIDYVVGMPCSHSPAEKCFSQGLSICIANKLQKNWVDALETEKQSGSSHPAKNAKRPEIRVKIPVEGSVLLIDDIVTSGSHIAEAVNGLRESADSVIAVGWIGGLVKGIDD